MDLLRHAMEAEEEDRLFRRWINGYQHLSFDAFRAELAVPPDRPTEEILMDVGEILSAWEVMRTHGDL